MIDCLAKWVRIGSRKSQGIAFAAEKIKFTAPSRPDIQFGTIPFSIRTHFHLDDQIILWNIHNSLQLRYDLWNKSAYYGYYNK